MAMQGANESTPRNEAVSVGVVVVELVEGAEGDRRDDRARAIREVQHPPRRQRTLTPEADRCRLFASVDLAQVLARQGQEHAAMLARQRRSLGFCHFQPCGPHDASRRRSMWPPRTGSPQWVQTRPGRPAFFALRLRARCCFAVLADPPRRPRATAAAFFVVVLFVLFVMALLVVRIRCAQNNPKKNPASSLMRGWRVALLSSALLKGVGDPFERGGRRAVRLLQRDGDPFQRLDETREGAVVELPAHHRLEELGSVAHLALLGSGDALAGVVLGEFLRVLPI